MKQPGRMCLLGIAVAVAATVGHAQELELRAPEVALRAGAAAALELLPAEAFEDAGTTPETVAGQVFEAMASHLWQPIRTAPRDSQIILGLRTEAGFRIALGHWEVRDEPVLDEMEGGAWSTATWWGTKPTHWAPLPQPPNR